MLWPKKELRRRRFDWANVAFKSVEFTSVWFGSVEFNSVGRVGFAGGV